MRIFGYEIRRAGSPPPPPITTKDAPKGQEKGIYTPRLYAGQQSKLITALGGSLSVMDVLGDPRSKILSFQAMVAAFPEVARMLRIPELSLTSLAMPEVLVINIEAVSVLMVKYFELTYLALKMS